jgi:hypothetical protein
MLIIKTKTMKEELKIFKFYKGEVENPFNSDTENAAASFWDYESWFSCQIKKSDSDLAFVFRHEMKKNPDEWLAVLNKKPVDVAGHFKLWLDYLLRVRLPGKEQSDDDGRFVRLYWDTAV